MNNMKLFAKDDNELRSIVSTSKCFSFNIFIDFGLDKCEKVSFKNGRNTLNR